MREEPIGRWIRVSSCVLAALALGHAQAAVNFGDRTPEVDEMVEALAPGKPTAPEDPVSRPKTRGMVVIAASSTGALSMRIAFEFGSSEVLARESAKLQRLAQALSNERLAGRRFRVIGHTDAVGPLQVNMRLSKQRALAVVQVLTQSGIDPGRLAAEGAGPHELLDQKRPEAAENRRVEIRVAP
jgi:OOP family OmpA-OmpF porin